MTDDEKPAVEPEASPPPGGPLVIEMTDGRKYPLAQPKTRTGYTMLIEDFLHSVRWGVPLVVLSAHGELIILNPRNINILGLSAEAMEFSPLRKLTSNANSSSVRRLWRNGDGSERQAPPPVEG